MKKPLLVLSTLGFVVFVFTGNKMGWFSGGHSESFPPLPEAPNFVVSKEFDGEWIGRRINVTNNNMCERTTITGRIVNGKASLRLTYNGTALQGWVSESGELRLYARHRQWDYRFSGTALDNTGSGKITGKWFLTNGPCKGEWYIERQRISALTQS
ncbi:hypothetical protein L4C33_14545 [Vibrio makurazakiensis]|uniref:hypothetical protein n=1 Tax=Vibrio makurazakiensis TaxID=2910250 RepID=UPI003D11AAE3